MDFSKKGIINKMIKENKVKLCENIKRKEGT